jgi:hypothetical protein
MKYRYVGKGSYLQGLPATDLDDALLDDTQKELLGAAVSLKMYEPVAEKKEKNGNDGSGSKSGKETASSQTASS